jgi:hypothetical protein
MSTQTAVSIAVSTSIVTGLLIYFVFRRQHVKALQEFEEKVDKEGRKIQEESLLRRRAAVLGKFLRI